MTFIVSPDDNPRVRYDALQAAFATPPKVATIDGSVVNNVTVSIASDTGDLVGINVQDPSSASIYGNQATADLVTLLASRSDAQTLAEYLVRPFPDFWFSAIEVQFNRLDNTQRLAVSQLDIGSPIKVSKLFPNMPSATVQELFVEGLEHRITTDSHVVTIYTSPTDLVLAFILDTSPLDDADYGLG